LRAVAEERTVLADKSASERWRVLGVSLALFIAAAVIRLFVAERQPIWDDELYHVIAGRSLHAGRGLQLYEGVYDRTLLFTYLISKLTPYFTWNLLIPRLPAVIAGALQVAALFVWLRRRTDWITAVSAATFLCLSDVAVQQSAYVRFYSIHALAFWLTAVSVYDLLFAPTLPRRLLALATAAVSAGIAIHLQPISLFGFAAIGAWALWMLLVVRPVPPWGRMLLLAGAALALLAGAGVVLLAPHWTSHAIHEFARSEQWNRAAARDGLYYIRFLIGQYPLFMAGFCLSAALAYRERAPLTVLCVAIVVVACLSLSLAGMKSTRYFIFALPFVFTVCGLGLSSAWRLLVDVMDRAPEGAPKRVWLALAGFTLVAALSANPGFAVTIASSLGGLKRAAAAHSLVFAAPGDQPWQSKRAEIAKILADRSVIATTDEFRILQYFGAFDVAFVPSYNTAGGKKDFALDRRTGRPQVSTLQNVALVYDCYAKGALLIYSDDWPAPVEIDPDVQQFLQQRTQHQVVAVDGEHYEVHLLTWDHAPAPPSPACSALSRRIDQGHRPAAQAFSRVATEPRGGAISFRR
jgi:hypothetical protein